MDYRKQLSGDVRLQRMAARIRKTGSMKDVYSVAKLVGEKAADAIEESLAEKMSESEVRAVVSPVLRASHDYIAELASVCINKDYENAGVGLEAIAPEYDRKIENEIVMEICRSIGDGSS